MTSTRAGWRTIAIVVVGVLVVTGAVALAASPRPEVFPTKPLMVVDRGKTAFGPWKVLVGQSASGPYMRVHRHGGQGGLSAHSRDGVLLGLSGAQVPDSAPAMLYGIVDDSVSHVTLEFVDGDTRELRLFRVEDVGFFYGTVATRRQVRVIALDDAWGKRLATATCDNHSGIGARSLLGNGCGVPDPEPTP